MYKVNPIRSFTNRENNYVLEGETVEFDGVLFDLSDFEGFAYGELINFENEIEGYTRPVRNHPFHQVERKENGELYIIMDFYFHTRNHSEMRNPTWKTKEEFLALQESQ